MNFCSYFDIDLTQLVWVISDFDKDFGLRSMNDVNVESERKLHELIPSKEKSVEEFFSLFYFAFSRSDTVDFVFWFLLFIFLYLHIDSNF